MALVITNPISNVPVNAKSHVHGWAQVWSEQLDAYIDHKCTPHVMNADVVYIDHGANFGGTLNLFGGANKEVYDKINIIAACDNIVSLDWDMPDYGAMLKKRIGAATTYEGITEEWCDRLSRRLSKVASLKQQDLPYTSATIGDSHAIAFSASGHSVLRNDGKTLFGALKSGFEELMRGLKPQHVNFSFGSIDIRHHILRHGIDVEDLVKRYIEQGDKLGDVTYSLPVPVEFEDRRIPKSGFYKGKPFYGSLSERKEITEKFIGYLIKYSGGRTINPPEEWYTMDPEMYAKTYMEQGSSFHIAPPFYRRHNWGVTALGA